MKLQFDYEMLFNVVEDTLKDGGLTIKPFTGEKPSGGYMVALQGYELQVPMSEFFTGIVADYIGQHAQKLMDNPSLCLGTWVNEGTVYLDLSENIQSREKALELGKERNQLAIFSLADMEEVTITC